MRLKKILRNPLIMRFASSLLEKYINLVFTTTRWQKVGEASFEKYDADKPFMACFWHNRLLMMRFAWLRSPEKFHMLISSHPDGQLIAQAMQRFGIQTVAGSTSKGGTNALRKILKILKEKNVVGITPDGPRGPRFMVTEGIIHIARLADIDIIPAAYATNRRIVLKSWDRFILPLPFGHGVFIWGKPVKISKDLDKGQIEHYRHLVETGLRHVSDEADRLCGHLPLE